MTRKTKINIEKALTAAQREIDEFILKYIPDQIRKRTRLGYGVDSEGGGKKKLKALSDKYKEQRKLNKGELSGQTSPNRSNLTYTGQLLENILIKKSGNKFIIELSNKKRKGDDLTNRQVGEYVEEAGRKFFNLADFEIKAIVNAVRKIILAKIRSRKT